MQPGTAPDEPERTFIENARRAQIAAAAIDTIADVGFAGASFARIAERVGISRGLISYHFAGKDDLMKEVVHQAAEEAKAYIRPRVLAESTGPGTLRAYIESNLAFMRDHRNNVIAMIEISRSADGRRIFYGDTAVVSAVGALEHVLSGLQTANQFRPDFDPHVMAIAIRAAIEAASPLLALDPEFDIDNYASEIAAVFDLATHVQGRA
ncbi:MAG TPA: TetR/AcrR family transcriptional regulator [Streptosporangiaceae bacterium]|jgi:AcrR family transcriptional regulator|nr:TetR/AcrR family transcriptional regulator [Streptosporangiaceae bacterium]